MRLIFWDWNGTLLDDAAYAIGVRNRVFPRFGLPTVDDLASYHQQFTFPVRVYYERAGVTDENFNEVAHAWMDEYLRGYREIPLFDDAVAALDAFRAAGLRQVVLSASQKDILRMQLEHAGILDRFDALLALDHIYATSKTEIGLAYLAQNGIAPGDCALIGDSLHDAEVAKSLGCRCVLVSRGHQSRASLLTAGAPVCESLAEAAALLTGA